MFRIGLKFPCNDLNRVCKVKKHGFARFYLTARYYETRARVKCDPDRLFKDGKFMSKFSGHKYSTDASKSDKGRGTGALITLGAITVGTLGVLSYARKNPEFRATLEGWIPGTDRAIQIIFREESSYFEFIRSFFSELKQSIVTLGFGSGDKKAGQGFKKALDCMKLEDYIPPQSAFTPLIEKKESPSVSEPYAEIRLSKEQGESIEVVAEKPPAPTIDVPSEFMPLNLIELEAYGADAASKAIGAYQKAVCAMQGYNADVMKVIEGQGSVGPSSIWERLRKATENRKAAVQDANEYAAEALKTLQHLYHLVDEPRFDAPPHMKTVAKRNMNKIMDDVSDAKRRYDEEVQRSNISERYWKQVQTARDRFNEELQILFPNININDKKLSVNEEAFDIFVLHMYHKITNLQKDLAKSQTVNEAKIRAALKASGEDMSEEKLNALICLEVDKERSFLQDEFSKKLLSEQKKFEDELRRQLKLQSQIHTDHLREAVLTTEREQKRLFERSLSEQAETDSIKYKTQLAAIIGRLRGVEAALKAHMEEERNASNAQILWSACQSLARAVKNSPVGKKGEDVVRPLEKEIEAVTKAAPKGDPLVCATLQGIPEEASKRGVFPEDTLRERFIKLENVARRLAMVPEGGASLPIYLLSYLQSFLIIKNYNPIPQSELNDQPIDVESLNTFDILHRARYWLDRGNFKMSLRYMNLLKGAPRSVSKEWMNEVRILLETQQAIDTLLAYAGSAGLVFLGAGHAKQVKK